MRHGKEEEIDADTLDAKRDSSVRYKIDIFFAHANSNPVTIDVDII